MRLIGLIIALAFITLVIGCCASSPSKSTTTGQTALTTAPITAKPTTQASVQTVLDAARIAKKTHVYSVTGALGAGGVVNVTIEETSYWDKPTVKVSFLEASYLTMAALVDYPGIVRVEINGYMPTIDPQGHEGTGRVFRAVVSDIAKAKNVNWKNLINVPNQDLAVTNFDYIGGPVMGF